MKTIAAIGARNIVELLISNIGNQYIVKNCNYKGTIASSRKRIPYFIMKILKADIVYFVSVSKTSEILAPIAKLLGKKVVFHWLGTDVWKQLHNKNIKLSSAKYADIHLSYSINLQEELKSLGISSILYALVPSDIGHSIAEMPSKHAVLLSLPDKTKEFYGYHAMIEVIKAFPNLKFHVVRSNTPEFYDYPNVVFEGVVSGKEMNRIYDEVSIVIRYPDHDGLSLLLMEATIKGKQMVYKFNHPFARKVTCVDDIIRELRDILSIPPEPNIAAHEYGVKEYNLEQSRIKGKRIIDSLYSTGKEK